jgi:signal transduction histidine kinase
MILANAERLAVVIEHIIRNAQDATSEQGTVSVSIRHDGRHAQLLVEDTGVGMDADFIRNRLFRPFDSTKGSKGMGIGAYQVREYIRLLGGDVEVQSSPGQGTQFAVSLPLVQSQDASKVVRSGLLAG